jgi:hypothetical protein
MIQVVYLWSPINLRSLWEMIFIKNKVSTKYLLKNSKNLRLIPSYSPAPEDRAKPVGIWKLFLLPEYSPNSLGRYNLEYDPLV